MFIGPDGNEPVNFLTIFTDGQKHLIGPEPYIAYLNAGPPACRNVRYRGEQWDFGYVEDDGPLHLFKRGEDAGEFFAVATPYRDPHRHGSIDRQKKQMVLRWIALGKKDQAIRTRSDPPFGPASFEEAQTDAELLARLIKPGTAIGTALFIDDMCFINKGDDDWLAIKGDYVIGPLYFRDFASDHGLDRGQQVLEGMRALTPKQVKDIVDRSR